MQSLKYKELSLSYRKLIAKFKLHTVKPAYMVTSIKGSPLLSSHLFWTLEPKHSANEPVLRGHLS